MQTTLDCAKKLARRHFEVDESLTNVIYIPDDKIVRMIEFTNIEDLGDKSFIPYKFKKCKDDGICFPSEIIICNSKRYRDILKGKCRIPKTHDASNGFLEIKRDRVVECIDTKEFELRLIIFEQISNIMSEKKVTCEDLAKRLNKRPLYVKKILEARSRLTLLELAKIAMALEVDFIPVFLGVSQTIPMKDHEINIEREYAKEKSLGLCCEIILEDSKNEG